MEKEKYKWLPYKLIKIYIIVTMLLAILGPIKYEFEIFYTFFMIIYVLIFLFITRYSMQTTSNYKTDNYTTQINDRKIMIILKMSITISLIIKIMLVISSIKIYGVPKMSNFFATFADVYSNMHHGEFIENIYRQIDTFCTFIFYFSMFVGIFWFKRIKIGYKLMLILSIILDLMYQIFYIGTQRSIITIVIVMIVIFTKSAIKKDYKIDKKKIIKLGCFLFIILIIILNVLSARKELWDENYYKTSNQFDLNHPTLVLFKSKKVRYDICNLISYFTQGWYGFTLALKTPFEWTYFLGGFRGINSVVSQIFTKVPNLTDFTYPVRAGKLYNFDGLACWYTIFPWLASDFTFTGALVFMGIVAKIYMKSWIQTIKYNNPIAFIITVLITIQYFFIVANNQIFIQRGESIAVVILFIIYCVFGKKYNYNQIENLKGDKFE